MHKSDFEALQKNTVWQEIVITLEEVKRGLLDDLANMDPIQEATELARKQGRLKMAEWIIAQPVEILREIEETIAKEERKEG